MTDLDTRPPTLPPGPPPAGPGGLEPPPPAPPLARPSPPRVLPSDIAAALAAFVTAVVGTWAVEGGVGDLAAGGVVAWTSLSQLSGLLAAGAGLLGLVLVARLRSIERRIGLDRMFVWHKWLGASMVVLVGVHVVTSVVAWADGTGYASAVADLTGREPYMAAATVGTLLLVAVMVTSLRAVRRRLSYETWYFLHLLAYAALGLAFAHEVVLGGHFSSGGPAWVFWVGVHVAVLAALVWGRWGAAVGAALRPLRVERVVPVGPGTFEILLGGRHLRRLEADSGQFVMVRPLVRHLWWQSHPFSLSARPTTHGLTLTVKDRGDASQAIGRLPVGARVAVEGPYGALVPTVLDPDRRLLVVVGGVGVAPARALLQGLPEGRVGDAPVVLFRARSADDLVHLDELDALVRARGGRVLTLVGPTSHLAVADPLAAESLRSVVPDLADRQGYVCGPERLIAAARAGLRAAGVPSPHVHFERSWW